MPEFPGLRRIGKIRDFEPYIRCEIALFTHKKSPNCLNLATLQITLNYGGHSSDQHECQECPGLATLQINGQPLLRSDHSSDGFVDTLQIQRVILDCDMFLSF